jgi:hypothetical protein
MVLTESGGIFGWGQGILRDEIGEDSYDSSNKNSKRQKIEIKSFDIHQVQYVESCHKFLLKKKEPIVLKPKQYYSRRCSQDKNVEISTISSNIELDNKSSTISHKNSKA